jgi:hypothetical protein
VKQHAIFLRQAIGARATRNPFAFNEGERSGTRWAMPARLFTRRMFDAVLMRKDPPFDNEYLVQHLFA